MKCPYCIKKCKECGRLLVANGINFNKHNGCKYGVQNKCRECKSSYNKTHYDDNKEYKKEMSKKYSQQNKEKRKEQNKQYYENNKEEINRKRKEYYKENKEIELRKNKEYQEKHREKIKEQRKEYYEENKDRLKEEKKVYYKNNPHINFNNSAKRRKREENQGNGISKEQWLEMMEFFNWKCAYSGITLDKNNRSIDHIVALNNNGEHEIWNCIPMYMPYNSSKNTNNILEWYIQQEFFSEERLNKIYEWVKYAESKWNKHLN